MSSEAMLFKRKALVSSICPWYGWQLKLLETWQRLMLATVHGFQLFGGN